MNEQEELANELQAEVDWLKEQLQKAEAALGKAIEIIDNPPDWGCMFCVYRKRTGGCSAEDPSEDCKPGIKEYLKQEATKCQTKEKAE